MEFECHFWEGLTEKEAIEKAELVTPRKSPRFHISRADSDGNDGLYNNLERLLLLPRTEKGRVKTTREEFTTDEDVEISDVLEAEYLVCTVVMNAAKRTNVQHHYSSRYWLALELSRQYDKIAECIPQFKRLPELNKMLTAVQLMAKERESIQKRIQTQSSSRDTRMEQAFINLNFGTLSNENVTRMVNLPAFTCPICPINLY